MDEDLKWEKQQEKQEKRDERKCLKEEKKMFNKLLDEEVEAIKIKDSLKIKELKETERQFLKDKEFRKGYTKGRKIIEEKHPKFFK